MNDCYCQSCLQCQDMNASVTWKNISGYLVIDVDIPRAVCFWKPLFQRRTTRHGRCWPCHFLNLRIFVWNFHSDLSSSIAVSMTNRDICVKIFDLIVTPHRCVIFNCSQHRDMLSFTVENCTLLYYISSSLGWWIIDNQYKWQR